MHTMLTKQTPFCRRDGKGGTFQPGRYYCYYQIRNGGGINVSSVNYII